MAFIVHSKFMGRLRPSEINERDRKIYLAKSPLSPEQSRNWETKIAEAEKEDQKQPWKNSGGKRRNKKVNISLDCHTAKAGSESQGPKFFTQSFKRKQRNKNENACLYGDRL